LPNELGTQPNKQGAVVVGDALVDKQYWVKRMPQPGEDVPILSARSHTGGSAMNTAMALGFLDTPVSFAGRIGSDDDGRGLIQTMETAGVDTSCVLAEGQTGYTLAMIDETGERTMFSCRGASAQPLVLTAKLKLALYNARVLMLSGYLLQNEEQASFALEAAKAVKTAGGIVAFDPSPVVGSVDQKTLRDMLAQTDMLLPNLAELEAMAGTGDIVRAMALLKVPCIALKKGGSGAQLALRRNFILADGKPAGLNAMHTAAPIPTEVVDTTGAGDAFNAGVLASYLRGEKPESWIVRGNALAARVIAREGASTLYSEK